MTVPATAVDPGVSGELRERVLKELEAAVNKYGSHCDLYDLSTMELNDAAVFAFFNLFQPEAMLVRDYALNPDMTQKVDVSTYITDFMEFHNNQWKRTHVSSAELIDLRYNREQQDQLIMIVRLSRTYYNAVNDAGTLQEMTLPDVRELELTYTVPVYDPEYIRIKDVDFAREAAVVIAQPTEVTNITRVTPGGLLRPDTRIVGVDEQQASQLARLISGELERYVRYATLRDSASGEINTNSILKFRNLFIGELSGRHVLDFMNFATNETNVEGYYNTAHRIDLFRKEGIRFKLNQPWIASIEPSNMGGYDVIVHAEKDIAARVNRVTGKVDYPVTNHKRQIAIRYNVSSYFNDALIVSVTLLQEDVLPEEQANYWGFHAVAGLGSLRADAIEDWARVTDQTKLGSTTKLGIGVEFRSNMLHGLMARNKPLFFSAGVFFNRWGMYAEAEDLREELTGWLTCDELLANFHYHIRSLRDDITVYSVEVPIGVDYRLLSLKGRNLKGFDLFVGARAVPTYSLSVKHNYTSNNFYNVQFAERGFTFYSEEGNYLLNKENQQAMDTINLTYGVGEYKFSNQAGHSIGSKFILGYQLGIEGHLSMGRSIRGSSQKLVIGFKYHGYVNSLWDQPEVDPKNDPKVPFAEPLSLPGTSGYKPGPTSGESYERYSLLHEFYENVRSSYVQFSLGWLYSFGS